MKIIWLVLPILSGFIKDIDVKCRQDGLVEMIFSSDVNRLDELDINVGDCYRGFMVLVLH